MSQFRLDGLADALAPMAQANAAASQFAVGIWGDLSGALAYAEGGLAAAIVDRPADEATSRGWECEGDTEGRMADEWSRLDVQPVFADALRYAGRDGAAAVLVLCQDRARLAEPMDEARIGQITSLRALSGDWLTAGPARYDDPARPRYGEPTTYQVRDPFGGSYEVHETRLIRVPGLPMAREASATRASSVPWAGRRRLSGRVAQSLQAYRDVLRWSVKLLERKQQPVYQADGLAAQLAEADAEREAALASGRPIPAEDAYAVIRARARAVDLTRGTLSTVVVDGLDKFTVTDLGLGGVDAVELIHERALCADAQMPRVVLFGESAKGLNASDEGGFEGWYALVGGQYQNRMARPGLERLTALQWQQDEFRGKEPPRWRIVFNPLWTPSEESQAKTALTRAQARKADMDAITALADTAVPTPEEVKNAIRLVVPEYVLSAAPTPPASEPTDGDAAA